MFNKYRTSQQKYSQAQQLADRQKTKQNKTLKLNTGKNYEAHEESDCREEMSEAMAKDLGYPRTRVNIRI